MRNAYKILVGNTEGKRPHGRPMRRWDDNIRMDLREVWREGVEWMNLAQDRGQGSCESGTELSDSIKGGKFS
jgi:hypothetical protein